MVKEEVVLILVKEGHSSPDIAVWTEQVKIGEEAILPSFLFAILLEALLAP